ncbi:MAG: 50S ribosomal protein L32 [Chloroflexi bacterium]|nr:50S ribosomal protein L32 [Chloroflexota bacterium]MCL5074104.1 50S ribosomal protein L32 [Chloroflexota bacterium]
MPPVPKRKTAKARQGERRSHLHLKPVTLVQCSQCHKPRLPHHVCPSCGYYDGVDVLKIKKTKKEKK